MFHLHQRNDGESPVHSTETCIPVFGTLLTRSGSLFTISGLLASIGCLEISISFVLIWQY